MLFRAFCWFVLVFTSSKYIVFAARTLLYWKKAFMWISAIWFYATPVDEGNAWIFFVLMCGFMNFEIWIHYILCIGICFVFFLFNFKLQPSKFLAVKSWNSKDTRHLVRITYKRHLWVWKLLNFFELRVNNLSILAKDCFYLFVTPWVWTV